MCIRDSTIALYPCGNPGEVLAMGFAVREIDFIVELVILAVNANHLQEIHILSLIHISSVLDHRYL